VKGLSEEKRERKDEEEGEEKKVTNKRSYEGTACTV